MGDSGHGTVMAIRAHRPTRGAVRLYEAALEALGPGRVFLVCDEITAPPAKWPNHVRRVPITRELVEGLGLRSDIPDLGWRCGDYAYYALASATPFDYAWLIEDDVDFWGISLGDFVKRFLADSSDLITPTFLAVADESTWFWAPTLSARGIQDTWRCFMPLTRASARAVGAARDLRLMTQYVEVPGIPYPNDEVVLATAVADLPGFRGTALREADPALMAAFDFSFTKRLRFILRWHYGGQRIFHPSLDTIDFAQWAFDQLAASKVNKGWRGVFKDARGIMGSNRLCLRVEQNTKF